MEQNWHAVLSPGLWVASKKPPLPGCRTVLFWNWRNLERRGHAHGKQYMSSTKQYKTSTGPVTFSPPPLPGCKTVLFWNWRNLVRRGHALTKNSTLTLYENSTGPLPLALGGVEVSPHSPAAEQYCSGLEEPGEEERASVHRDNAKIVQDQCLSICPRCPGTALLSFLTHHMDTRYRLPLQGFRVCLVRSSWQP